jgi:hypothetical protein
MKKPWQETCQGPFGPRSLVAFAADGEASNQRISPRPYLAGCDVRHILENSARLWMGARSPPAPPTTMVMRASRQDATAQAAE